MDETKHELLQRISVDPNICFGKPCVRGHRIWVSLILDMLASGMSHQEILRNYPGLEESDLRACIAYGAEMSRERFVDLPERDLTGKLWVVQKGGIREYQPDN